MGGTVIDVFLFFENKTIKDIKRESPDLLSVIKMAKTKASTLNKGKGMEEKAPKATYHWCTHDESNPQPCEEIDI